MVCEVRGAEHERAGDGVRGTRDHQASGAIDLRKRNEAEYRDQKVK